MHLYGFSPVCVLRCLVRSGLVLKELEQFGCVQMKGLSPVWLRRCTVSWERSLARYGHSWQLQMIINVGNTKTQNQF